MMTKVALIQMEASESPETNLEKSIDKISTAVQKGGQIIALQELFTTRYFCRTVDPSYFNLAESIPGPVTQKLCRLAGEYGVIILAPIFERVAPGMYYNSMVVIDTEGNIAGVYRKMHIPDDPGFYEKYYFSPGDNGYQVYKTRHGNIGTLICWDQWFPEAARITVLMGAELLVYPTAIATLPEENETDKFRYLNAWQTIQKSHAISNGCYVAAVNRVGNENGLKFWGHSFICDPFGEIIAEAGEEEEILIAEIDITAIENQRQTWPFFRDRRTDSYKNILKQWIR